MGVRKEYSASVEPAWLKAVTLSWSLSRISFWSAEVLMLELELNATGLQLCDRSSLVIISLCMHIVFGSGSGGRC
ncbi:hypothetical protein TYRP_013849 [Tyrophagus putrescentiae]|nr:hypothetical protein TYRP_013849 [Tyrophagus putrescentiae]